MDAKLIKHIGKKTISSIGDIDLIHHGNICSVVLCIVIVLWSRKSMLFKSIVN